MTSLNTVTQVKELKESRKGLFWFTVLEGTLYHGGEGVGVTVELMVGGEPRHGDHELALEA